MKHIYFVSLYTHCVYFVNAVHFGPGGNQDGLKC